MPYNNIHVIDGIQKINMCATQYRNNLCANPIPAMVQQCANWETCMNRNPVVTRAKLAAAIIAEVINEFVEPMSGKTMVRKPLDLLVLRLTWLIIRPDRYLHGLHWPSWLSSTPCLSYIAQRTRLSPILYAIQSRSFPSHPWQIYPRTHSGA